MRLFLLAAALGVAGCSLVDDCRFGGSAVDEAGVLTADGARITDDTLTIAVVRGSDPEVTVAGPMPVLLQPEPTADATVLVHYRPDGVLTGDGRATPPLAVVVRGDTAFVASQGLFDVFQRACTPAADLLSVDVRSVGAPEGVRAVRVVPVSPDALSAATVRAFARYAPSASPTFV